VFEAARGLDGGAGGSCANLPAVEKMS
jgi:hypothetical protein